MSNKYEKQYWTRKAPACLFTLTTMSLRYKPRLCINIHHYTLQQLGIASRIELQPHWLQHADAVLVKVQCQVEHVWRSFKSTT